MSFVRRGVITDDFKSHELKHISKICNRTDILRLVRVTIQAFKIVGVHENNGNAIMLRGIRFNEQQHVVYDSTKALNPLDINKSLIDWARRGDGVDSNDVER